MKKYDNYKDSGIEWIWRFQVIEKIKFNRQEFHYQSCMAVMHQNQKCSRISGIIRVLSAQNIK